MLQSVHVAFVWCQRTMSQPQKIWKKQFDIFSLDPVMLLFEVLDTFPYGARVRNVFFTSRQGAVEQKR